MRNSADDGYQPAYDDAVRAAVQAKIEALIDGQPPDMAMDILVNLVAALTHQHGIAPVVVAAAIERIHRAYESVQ